MNPREQWDVKDIIDVAIGRIKFGFDFIIVITGKVGIGKSTKAYKILDRIPDFEIMDNGNQSINFNMFNPKRDIVFSRKDFLKQIASKKYGCILADELVNVGYSRQFWEREQIKLIQALNMYRDSRNIIIGCIPEFLMLDKPLQSRIHMRIDVKRRGFAIIHLPRDSSFSPDRWDIKTNQKKEGEWSQRGRGYPRYSELTTYRGYIMFGDLNPKQKELYQQLKEEKRGRMFEEYKEISLMNFDEDAWLKRIVNDLKAKKYTEDIFNMICSSHNLKPEFVRNKINALLKKENNEFRWRDFIVKKEKFNRDALSFKAKQKTEEPKEEIIINDIDTTTSKEMMGGVTEDIFGFES